MVVLGDFYLRTFSYLRDQANIYCSSYMWLQFKPNYSFGPQCKYHNLTILVPTFKTSN